MPCLLVALALLFPRVVLAVLFFFTNFLDKAYQGFLIPLLGFILMPTTTIAWAWVVNTGQVMSAVDLVVLVVAVVLDLGSFGGGYRSREW